MHANIVYAVIASHIVILIEWACLRLNGCESIHHIYLYILCCLLFPEHNNKSVVNFQFSKDRCNPLFTDKQLMLMDMIIGDLGTLCNFLENELPGLDHRCDWA